MEEMIEFVPQRAVLKNDRGNYTVTIPNTNAKLILKRNIDFGKFGQANKPSLLKSGAEKILMAYGVESRFILEQAIEQFGEVDKDGNTTMRPLFYYRFKCELYKNGQHITDGYGSASSDEKACGRAMKADVANQRLKIAKKRAEVDAVLLLAQISDAFYADLEDSTIENGSVQTAAADVMRDDEKISKKQIARIFKLASNNGVTADEAKNFIKSKGYDSAVDILNKDYDDICNAIQSGKATAIEQ